MEPIASNGDYIGGRFVPPLDPTGEIESRSPADLDDVVGVFPVDTSQVDAAVLEARVAQRAWARLPLEDRLARMHALKDELARLADPLAERIAREIGKPLWEARTEVAALRSKIDITESEGLALVRGFVRDGGKLECHYRPHGVLAVIGPFNFPLHLSHGHIVPALLTGNAVVYKPSELAPATAQLYAEAFDAAGFPAGVFNMVQGRGPEGAALGTHDDVDGVLFTGSYETGVELARANAHRPGRMLALELGGKNAAIVLNDAPLEKALFDVVFSAFATAGQRCTSVSRLIVERGIAEPFLDALVERAAALRVGSPFQADTFMGPLASQASFDKFQVAQKAAEAEGSRALLPSQTPDTGRRGHYVGPSIHCVSQPSRESRYQGAEIFGPDIAVFTADDAEHACALADATNYGLSAAVYTRTESLFDLFARRLQVGCISWNAPTAGSSSLLPFGGLRNSGNHRPAALFSTLYCTWPQAITRGDTVVEPSRMPPGMHWTSPSN